ncbi:hypothetical protein [Sorangium sp. So ce394]|uniref:hypothetical protein n=1 Tax=Sorangium sp. So ce394 TaxID=3133310 RepID=UPI003F5C2BD4
MTMAGGALPSISAAIRGKEGASRGTSSMFFLAIHCPFGELTVALRWISGGMMGMRANTEEPSRQ